MPRLRGSELPHQRQSLRPLHLRSTTSSDGNSIHRTAINRRVKLDDLHEMKRGSKAADLEKKLSETLEGLKKIKEQLASAEAAKRDALKELEKTKQLVVFNPPVGEEEDPFPVEEDSISTLTLIEDRKSKEEEEEVESKRVRAMLECALTEKEDLKKEAKELARKLEVAEEELRESRTMAERLKLKLQAEEADKASMEAEMKCLRVQTDQWRKAAEAAAAYLPSGDDPAPSAELNGRQIDDRFRTTVRFMGEDELPAGGVGEEVEGRKGAAGGDGIRRFRDLWKKRSQEKRSGTKTN